MKMLYISVADKIATYQKREGDIICGNSNYKIKFTFDSEWDEYTDKTARFVWNGRYYDVDFTGDTCSVPIITGTDSVKVGVYAGELETTTPATIGCRRSILCEASTPTTETERDYANEAKESAKAAKVSETNAANSASQAEASKNIAAEYISASTRIVQTTGNGADKVMSQKAVSGLIDGMDKRITNLEAGISSDLIYTDDSVAFEKTVPVNALPYATFDTLGGRTIKSVNLLNIQDEFVSGEGAYNQKLLGKYELPAGTYTLTAQVANMSGCQAAISIRAYSDYNINIKNISIAGGFTGLVSATFTVPATERGIHIYAYSNITSAVTWSECGFSEFMINEGETALPYEPYFEGMISAPVDSVEIVGANFFDKSKVTNATETNTGFSFTWTGVANAPVLIGKLENIAPQLKVGDSVALYGTTVNSSVSGGKAYFYLSGSGKDWLSGNFITITDEDLYGQVYAYGTPNALCEYKDVIITKIKDAPYRPYKDPATLSIPEEVQDIEGYGIGVSDTIYNYIDFDKRKFVKRVGKMASVVATVVGEHSNGQPYCSLYCLDSKSSGEVLSNNYAPSGWTNKNGYIYIINGAIIITDSRFTSVEEANRVLSEEQTEIYYELATPEVIDISQYLEADNYIEVEGGGTLTFIQKQYSEVFEEYEYSEATVPSTITYVLKEGEAV